MSDSAPDSMLRTISGDSYGKVITEGDASGLVSDERNTDEDAVNAVSYIIIKVKDSSNEDLTHNSCEEVRDDQSVRDENDNLTGELSTNDYSGDMDATESVNRVQYDLTQDPISERDEKDEEDAVISDNENGLTGLVEDGGDQLDSKDDVPNEDSNENNGGEMDYSKCDTKENITVFVNGQSGMEDLDGNEYTVKKTHTIHLTPEALGENDDNDEDLDRNSPLGSYDGDDVESNSSPVMLNTNCISARSDNRPQTTSTMCELPGGLRAKANTPASFYNNNLDSPIYQNDKVSGRLSSRESRDEVFNRAMTLMSNRCTSARGGENVLYSSREPPYGANIPHYFYVYQKKPQPLAPLKAWRGYKGNVYFEPMRIQRVNNNEDTPDYLDHDGSNTRSNLASRQIPSRSMLRSAPLPQSRGGNSAARGLLSNSASFRPPYRLVNSSSQVYVMDKARLVNDHNSNISTDLRFIEGVESTGSLSVSHTGFTRPQSNPTGSTGNPFMTLNGGAQPNKDKRLLQKRDRICRGSNFHKSKDKSELGMNRNNNKVFSIKISDPKKKLITPDNSRRTSGAGSRMSVRKNTPGSANSNSNAKIRSNQSRSTELIVSGDKFALPLPKVHSPMHVQGGGLVEQSHYRQYPAAKDRITLDDMDAFINASDNLPRVNQVHVTLGDMVEDSLPATTPAYSDNESNDEDRESVDFVDMNFKGLTTAPSIPVDAGY